MVRVTTVAARAAPPPGKPRKTAAPVPAAALAWAAVTTAVRARTTLKAGVGERGWVRAPPMVAVRAARATAVIAAVAPALAWAAAGIVATDGDPVMAVDRASAWVVAETAAMAREAVTVTDRGPVKAVARASAWVAAGIVAMDRKVGTAIDREVVMATAPDLDTGPDRALVPVALAVPAEWKHRRTEASA